MAYQSWSVVFGEQPSAAKWNIIGTNMAGFNDGTAIADGAITPDKMNFGASSASVVTQQTTTSTSFTDLATVGPAATVTVPASGFVLVMWRSRTANNTGGSLNLIGVELSGANTASANDDITLVYEPSNNLDRFGAGTQHLYSGLTPGATTFTMKYRTTGGTADFEDREIIAIPIGN